MSRTQLTNVAHTAREFFFIIKRIVRANSRVSVRRRLGFSKVREALGARLV
jgi:hypothetical protein